MSGSNPIADRGKIDSGDGVIRSWFDWSATNPSTAVVETVATAANRTPTEFKPLYEDVDPDALDRLVPSDGSSHTDVTVSFTVADHRVTVDGSGEVVVHPVDATF